MVRDFVEELPDGSLRSPAGVTYRRTAERVRRAIGNELVAAGAAIVTNVYPDGLQWHEGQEATSLWEQIKPRLVTGARPNPRDLQWVGHVWESDSGHLLLRFDGEH